MFRIEKDYQEYIIKELKKDSWVYNIPDTTALIKPFDLIGIKDGIGFAIELKIADLKKGLSYEQAYKMLRPNQVSALNLFQQNGGDASVWVYNKGEGKEYRFRFKFLDGISTEL